MCVLKHVAFAKEESNVLKKHYAKRFKEYKNVFDVKISFELTIFLIDKTLLKLEMVFVLHRESKKKHVMYRHFFLFFVDNHFTDYASLL